MKIQSIQARQILDSRGNPTVEADVILEDGAMGRAAVPSGASTGTHEAHELRDGGQAYGGAGVSKAIAHIHDVIQPVLKGMDASDQSAVDQAMLELDGTDNKSKLGANATLAVSLAVAHAAASAKQMPLYRHINELADKPTMSLPMPMVNVLNGGKHANDSSDFQEFMIIPNGAETMHDAVRMASEIFHALKKEIASNDWSTAVGDEGGFTLPIKHANTEMLDMLLAAVKSADYEPGKDVVFAMDVAASEFYKDKHYRLQTERRTLTAKDMVSYMTSIAGDYPVVSIEDALAEDDWSGWQELTRHLPKLQLVGDDLLVTNPVRLQKAIEKQAGNAILIKPNQIGTLSETIATIRIAQGNGWKTVVSHRSGETEDVTIAHLAVGMGAGQIKTGSMSRSERIAKYNELMRIEADDPSLQLTHPF